MKKSMFVGGTMLLILVAGGFLLPHGAPIEALTAGRIQQQVERLHQDVNAVQNVFQISQSKAAVIFTDVLVGLGALVAVLIFHLLIALSIQVYSLRREVADLHAQIASIRGQVAESAPLLAEVARYFEFRRSIEEASLISRPQFPSIVPIETPVQPSRT